MFVGLFAFIVLASVVSATVPHMEPNSQEFIDYINNNPDSTWEAGVNYEQTVDSMKKLLGTDPTPSDSLPPVRNHDINRLEDLPESFDPREHWPHCPTLKEIRNQRCCGSCWAFGAVSAMSDRICIASKGNVNAHLSAEDLVSCCPKPKCARGCEGTKNVSEAWVYYNTNGLVTGGGYNSHQGCRPYTIQQEDDCYSHLIRTPKCERVCEEGYEIPYENDKHYGKAPYSISSDENQIKAELMLHGPIEATYIVYLDFYNYKKGVYQYTTGQYMGGHAVKMMGWGVENGTPYWLIANSWGPKWGENGFFKIRRGTNECGIESNLVAGEPDLKMRLNFNGRKL